MNYDNRIKLHFWLHIAFIVVAIVVAIFIVHTSKVAGNEVVAIQNQFLETSVASWQTPNYRTIEIVATVTAYSSTPEETDDTPFLTASGEIVDAQTIACPKDIPFGSVVETSWGQYTCDDRMHERNEGKFDIWMETKIEAIEFGIRIVPIKVNIFY